MRLGIIGHGTIGQALLDLIRLHAAGRLDHVALLVRHAVDAPQGVTVCTSLDAFLETRPDLIVECAGHGAVRTSVPRCLGAGIDTIIASTGALADDGLYGELRHLAQASGARLILPTGAIGGIDMLSSLRMAGIHNVAYEGHKPPEAWKGTPAEQVVDLDHLTAETPVFIGTAREAARLFPKNANVTAALALDGIGFDRTKVTLIADPAATGNSHSYIVDSAVGSYRMTITGAPSGNAKTSATTAFSLLREILNRLPPAADQPGSAPVST
ncbi:MAG TPA: aspartate dehydrogenase [Paracoccaceae bacterium]|nr:aspartate dehydrogenase [Paracoccaceae bacterium]